MTLMELKAMAYDLMATIQNAQAKLNDVNRQIAQMLRNPPPPEEPPKE